MNSCVKFQNYWRFFSENTFAKGAQLRFFEDGSFAVITQDEQVSLYSQQAELIGRYENAFVLDNGCVCERYGENIIIHSINDNQYYIPCPSVALVIELTNAVSFQRTTESGKRTTELYFITPNSNDLRHHSLVCGNIKAISATGLLLTESKLLTADFEEIPLPAFHRIDFLPDGGYIVYFEDMNSGCALYNEQHQCLLRSERDFSILPLGDKVLYEQALIICPKTGQILAEYAGETAIYDVYHVYSHRVNGRLWLGGEMKYSYTPLLGRILYYWHGGHFYVAPQVGITVLEIDDLRKQFTSPSLEHYLMRIREIMP